MISVGNKILIDSQDKKGFVGFRTKLRARNAAHNTTNELPHINQIYDLNIFPVYYESLPDTHPAMLLMADNAMQQAEDQSVDYSQLQVTTEKTNQ